MKMILRGGINNFFGHKHYLTLPCPWVWREHSLVLPPVVPAVLYGPAVHGRESLQVLPGDPKHK